MLGFPLYFIQRLPAMPSGWGVDPYPSLSAANHDRPQQTKTQQNVGAFADKQLGYICLPSEDSY